MERLPGTTLEEAWPSMSHAQKEIVCVKLRDIMQELRALPSPGGYCSLDKKPLPDGLIHFEGTHEDPSIISGGPFATEQDLNRAILQRAATFHEHLRVKRNSTNVSFRKYSSIILQPSATVTSKGRTSW